jgi:MarR family 2-MHQ and catechol resistance regulon transcriptional repressor
VSTDTSSNYTNPQFVFNSGCRELHDTPARPALTLYRQIKYLDVKVNSQMSETKLESLTGGSGVHVFLVLWKAANAVQSFAEQSISELDMCGSDFAVLEALLHKGPLPVNEIGKKVLLTSGSITVAVDRLETKGLVERRAHGTDRRARVVHLTKEGRKLITRIYADHAAEMERLASASLGGKERETLIRLLKKIGYKATAVSKEEGNDQPPVTRKNSKGRK